MGKDATTAAEDSAPAEVLPRRECDGEIQKNGL